MLRMVYEPKKNAAHGRFKFKIHTNTHQTSSNSQHSIGCLMVLLILLE